MTITLHLPPDVEFSFLEEAQQKGMSVDDLVSEIVVARRKPFPGPSYELPPAEWVRQFEDWTASLAGRNLPILSDANISRESIYEERGL